MARWLCVLTIFFNCSWAPSGWAGESFEKGVSLFHEEKYEEAWAQFKKAELTENKELRSLFGQLICCAALKRSDQIVATIQTIQYKVQQFVDCETPPDEGPITQEKQLMAYMCRRHIREIANRMRQSVEKLVRESVPGAFEKIKMLRHLYPFIDTLEQTGISCCQSQFPLVCCLDPLLEQLESWDSFGLPLPSK